MKLVDSSPAHKEMHLAVALCIKEHSERLGLSQTEVLALLAYMTGQCIAFQDQSKMTSEIAMGIIAANLELGNTHAVEAFVKQKPSGNA